MFEIKLTIAAPGLEASLNNLANAIATGTAPIMTVSGDPYAVQVQPVTVGNVPPLSVVSEDDGEGESSTNEFDGWGLRHDTRIHTDSKSINKGDKQWRQKKKLDDAFVDGVKRELIAEAVAAGRYTGPAELAPGYVAPVEQPAPVVPAAPVQATPAVHAAPVVPAAPVQATPAVPENTDPGKIYNTQVLQSGLMQMFGQITGDRAAPISQKIMALYETQNVMTINDPDKLKSIIDLIDRINSNPAEAETVVAQAEALKAVGGAF